MLANRLNLFLLAEAEELATGGGPADDAAAESPAAEENAGEDAGEQREPTLAERAVAIFRDKSALLADLNDAKEELAQAQAIIAELRTENATAESQAAELSRELAAVRSQLAEVEAAVGNVEAATAERVAALGFAAALLPAAEEEAPQTTKALLERAAKTADAKEKWELTRQASALRWQEN